MAVVEKVVGPAVVFEQEQDVDRLIAASGHVSPGLRIIDALEQPVDGFHNVVDHFFEVCCRDVG